MRFKQVAKGIMGVMLAVALTGCASGNSKQEDAAKEKLVVAVRTDQQRWDDGSKKQNLSLNIYQRS